MLGEMFDRLGGAWSGARSWILRAKTDVFAFNGKSTPCSFRFMPDEATKYFMGDVLVGDVGLGFLVRDSRDDETEPTIDEGKARAIVSAAGGDVDAGLGPVNLFEISQDEFDLYREAEIPVAGLPEGLQIWQVKR